MCRRIAGIRQQPRRLGNGDLSAARDTPSKGAKSSSYGSASYPIYTEVSRRNRQRSSVVHVIGRSVSVALLCSVGVGALLVTGYAIAWIVPGLKDSAE